MKSTRTSTLAPSRSGRSPSSGKPVQQRILRFCSLIAVVSPRSCPSSHAGCPSRAGPPTTSDRSTNRLAYPHSLSYQPSTLTRVIPEADGITMVSPESKVHEAGLPTMSDETMGSSV